MTYFFKALGFPNLIFMKEVHTTHMHQHTLNALHIRAKNN